MKQIKLMQGDNILSLKKLPDNSIDSIVTDPPYGLSFMNKKWDYEVPSVEFWKEALRVLKPGGHVLSFGGTRTYHRMVVNMEDAGFEIRDQIMWIYASGFPKSLNIGKAFDKKQGNEREIKGEYIAPDGNKRTGVLTGTEYYKEDGDTYNNDDRIITKGSSQYEGWGTALKPANEPICLARKPLSEKTIVDNVIKWGTGGINVDGCRIGTDDKWEGRIGNGKPGLSLQGSLDGTFNSQSSPSHNEGRFPANILFDEEAAQVLDEQSGISKSNTKPKVTDKEAGNMYHKYEQQDNNYKQKLYVGDYSDKGGASRFFYVAKVGKKERNLGLDDSFDKETKGYRPGEALGGQQIDVIKKNFHPTLKPINLMTYLCRLITPPGGIILDPFMGSGSTGISACLEGFRFVGMELDEDYFKIAEARVNSFEEYRKLLK